MGVLTLCSATMLNQQVVAKLVTSVVLEFYCTAASTFPGTCFGKRPLFWGNFASKIGESREIVAASVAKRCDTYVSSCISDPSDHCGGHPAPTSLYGTTGKKNCKCRMVAHLCGPDCTLSQFGSTCVLQERGHPNWPTGEPVSRSPITLSG